MTTNQTAPRRTPQRSSHRTALLVGSGMLLALLVISVLTRDDAAFSAPLDPRNPKRDGAQAVARVLDGHGVGVRIARGQRAFLGERVDSSTTVVVTDPEQLGRSTLGRFRVHARDAGSVVLVGAASVLGDQFDIEPGSGTPGRRSSRCAEPLTEGLVVRTYDGSALATPGCFGSEGSAALVRRDRTWLLATPASLTNEHVLDSDNAALALRLLGQQGRVVWYVADAGDTAAGDGVSLSGLLPAWLVPGLFLLLAGLASMILWRGRRLGPLVTEPLPVAVRAVESTQSRGRIYRRTGDRQHAADILVGAARRRLRVALQLPRDGSVDALALAVASRTGRDPRAVLDLLGTPAVTQDSQLVLLGQQLNDLEIEVRDL